MTKVQIKSEKLTPLGGVFSIMEQFDALLAQTINSTLGLRCTLFGYQYSEILRSLMCVYLCGGSCIEDISTHLMKHLSLHPTLRTCSADTILRAIGELTCKNITYKSATGKSYDFNTANKMNCLLIKALLATGQLKSGQEYNFDFDHQFIETEKYDAKPTYKKFLGYSPGVAVINDMIVGIENRDGNTNVRFNQRETLKIVIPQTATYEIMNKTYAYKVVDGVAHAAIISVQPLSDGVNYIVVSGLNDGDVIITEGAGYVKEGMKIQAKQK